MSEELKACKWCGKPLGKFELHERLHCVYALCERAEESENFARALKKEFDRVGNASYAKDLHMRQLEEANNKLKSKILEITDIAMGKGYAEIRPLRAERDRAVSMVERLIEERKQLIAQLAAEKDKNEHMLGCIFEYETIAPDGELGVSLLNMDNHIRSLEADNAELKRKLANAEQMVERLIEAGERLSIHSRMVDDIDVWNALVAEWQANQKGDSNV
jgi:hypothetical protein